MKILTTMLALTAATLSLAPATAQIAASAEGSAIVSYGDLNLNRAEDRSVLDRRIRSAIRTVCGPTSPADPVGARIARDCRAALRAQADDRRAELLAGVGGQRSIVVALAR